MWFNTIKCKTFLFLLLVCCGSAYASSKNIDVGLSHSCALTPNQQIECWGANFFQQTEPPAGQFLQLSMGLHAGCAIRNDNALVCWGQYDAAAVPQGAFIHVDARKERYCAVRTDNTLVCWGAISAEEQAAIPLTPEFIEVYVGDYRHACALKTDRSVVCWGSNRNPLDSANPSMQSTVPADIQGRAFSVFDVGDLHNCGILEDTQTVYCWGSNRFSEIDIPPDVTFTDIATGGYTSCGLMANGMTSCWGQFDSELLLSPPNADCQCGRNGDPLQCLCTQLVGTQLRELSSVNTHVCGLSLDGRQRVCWGKNHRGQADTTFAPQLCQAVGVNRDTSEVFFISPTDFSVTTKPLLGLPALPRALDTYFNGFIYFATHDGVYATTEPSDPNSYIILQHPSLLDIQDISVAPNGGAIWGWDTQAGLWSISTNPANGFPDISTFSVNVPPPPGISITHLSWEYVGDILYGLQQNGDEQPTLWSYQPTTGTLKAVCPQSMRKLSNVTAFDAFNENWVLFSSDNQTRVQILEINSCQWVFDGEIAPQLPNVVGLGWQCL